MLVYDTEIIKAILKKGETPIDGIDYCDGWRDFDNMGISVICAYDATSGRYRVFTKESFKEFQAMASEISPVVSFNGVGFDDKLCAANGLEVASEYDILREIWIAQDLDPDNFDWRTHGGVGLDAMAIANGNSGKTGNGAFAPVMWQRGEIGSVIDYCLEDVRQTLLLAQKIIKDVSLVLPGGEVLPMRTITVNET